MTMRNDLLCGLFCLVLTGEGYAQAMAFSGMEMGASESTALAQRTLQYEMLLGSELSPTIAVCIDEKLGNVWMLPTQSASDLSVRATERIRRRMEICLAEAGSLTIDFRFAAELRRGMEAQLKAAHGLELAKHSARNCLDRSPTQDSYKDCMATALPAALGGVQWNRWLMLFERRANLVALGTAAN